MAKTYSKSDGVGAQPRCSSFRDREETSHDLQPLGFDIKKTGPASGHSARTNDNATIAMLKNVHTRLRGADADYDGHRVRAMGHIATAIHHLDTTSGVSIGMVDGFSRGMGFGGGNMPQAESDGILRDAEYQLNKTLAALPTGINAAAHHQSAHLSVTGAIHEFQTALKIR